MIVLAEVKYAVYGDYDGNAPDTADLGVFDTEEEANRVIGLLWRAVETNDGEDLGEDARLELEKLGKDARLELEKLGVVFPCVEGFQWSLSFKVREVLVRSSKKELTLAFYRSDLSRFFVALNSTVMSVDGNTGVPMGEDGDGWDFVDADVWDNITEGERKRLRGYAR